MIMNVIQVLAIWKDFATVKMWKKSLKIDSNDGYESKARPDLELYFERIEPIIIIYSDLDPIPPRKLQEL